MRTLASSRILVTSMVHLTSTSRHDLLEKYQNGWMRNENTGWGRRVCSELFVVFAPQLRFHFPLRGLYDTLIGYRHLSGVSPWICRKLAGLFTGLSTVFSCINCVSSAQTPKLNPATILVTALRPRASQKI